MKKQKIKSNKSVRKSFWHKVPRFSKKKAEWLVLLILITAIPFAIWSNLFAYEYYYLKCEGKPMEINGEHYRIPGDEGYGIRPGSDYSNCSYTPPPGIKRDPSSKVEIALKQQQAAEEDRIKRLTAEHHIYVPKGYEISELFTSDQKDYLETNFTVTTKDGQKLNVQESKKGYDNADYTELCSKPPRENWSGTVIGVDKMGRSICRANLSKYIAFYSAGAAIGDTVVQLRSYGIPKGKLTDDMIKVLDGEVLSIFDSMERYRTP